MSGGRRSVSDRDGVGQSSCQRTTSRERRHSTDGNRDEVADRSGRRTLQRRHGNQTIQQLVNDGAIQPKLEVGDPDDRYEREADRVAETVMGMATTRRAERPTGTGRPERIQRMCSRCQRRFREGKPLDCPDCEATLQRERAAAATPSIDGRPVHSGQSLGGGQPLSASVRSFFEPRFGYDFADVRVHTGARADEAARSVNARAFTVGRDVVFRSDTYRPETRSGKRLLAHELTHVVQQSGATVRGQAAAGPGVEARRKPMVMRQEEDDTVGPMVMYSGGQQGTIRVFNADGTVLFSATAYSGQPGSRTHEVGQGPIPDGQYGLHPTVEQPVKYADQWGEEGSTCGVKPIWMGYQNISAGELIPCASQGGHCSYTGGDCGDVGEDYCAKPADCWGETRLRIEGSASVSTPGGGSVQRGQFYIHGGESSYTASSGCIKVLDDGVFDTIANLGNEVPLCVGSACPPRPSFQTGQEGNRSIVFPGSGGRIPER